jgi:hypothetical protein
VIGLDGAYDDRQRSCVMPTHSGAGLAPIGRPHIDMHIIRWGAGVIGQLGLGLLAANLMSTHPMNSVAPRPGNVSPTAIVAIAGAPREWRLEVDEAAWRNS